MSGERFFAYELDTKLKPFWLPFGLKPDRDGVRVTDETFTATFGRYRLETPRTNIDGAHVTRDYRWWTAGGVRGSMKDRGLTFGTNAQAGVCVHFVKPVPHVFGWRDHSALTVTVADLDGLVALLGEAEPRS
jgi:hypothetical protein